MEFKVISTNINFDLIGWDGYYFPYILSIYDFMPITGKIHQPPPVHQTFKKYRVSLFVYLSRAYLITIQKQYSNSTYIVMLIQMKSYFMLKEKFMSRKGIEKESITYHPSGLPHGPQPEMEESIGAKETNEMAVMIDTFKPLKMTENINEIDDKNYPLSWLENDLRSD